MAVKKKLPARQVANVLMAERMTRIEDEQDMIHKRIDGVQSVQGQTEDIVNRILYPPKKRGMDMWDYLIIAYVVILVVYIVVLILKQGRAYVRTN